MAYNILESKLVAIARQVLYADLNVGRKQYMQKRS